MVRIAIPIRLPRKLFRTTTTLKKHQKIQIAALSRNKFQ